MTIGSWRPLRSAFLLFLASSTLSASDDLNVVLVGWDGAQRSHVKESLARNELPVLKRLSEEGVLVAIDITRVTDTKAGWAQILTGYEPEVTGVFRNAKFQPIPKGLTVFERLERHFGPRNIATVAVIGKKGNVGAAPEKKTRLRKGKNARQRQKVRQQTGKVVVENGVRYRVVPGEPFFNASRNMDEFINGLGKDETVGEKTLELLDKYGRERFFFFVHFAEVDHQGHKFGENSGEYNDALISADTWTGKIIRKLKDLGVYDRTFVYITADHGFDEGLKGHGDAPYVFLATNDGKVIRRGERADITPTILERFGLKLGKLDPPLDGVPLSKPLANW